MGRATSYRLFLAVDWDPAHGIDQVFGAWVHEDNAVEEANLRAEHTPDVLESGDPGAMEDGVWYIRDPRGVIGALRTHTVTEHDDGTITVSPSILDPDGWHGYLERGVWREV